MMDVRAFLSMDVGALGGWIVRGWIWWRDELLALLPAGLRGRLVPRTRLIAELQDGRILLHESAAGRAIAVSEDILRTQMGQLTLALPRAAVLQREIALPALTTAELRRLIALDMDRLTPLRPEEVIFDIERGPVLGAGRRQVTIGIVRRPVLQALLDKLTSLGLGQPAAISLADGGSGVPRFDFLRIWRNAQGETVGISSLAAWWTAIAVLVALNIAFLIVHDVASLDSLQDQVDAQQPSVALAEVLHRRVEAEIDNRKTLLTRRAAAAPLPLLAAVTHALPDGAYVQRYEWNGVSLRLAGNAQAGMNATALLAAGGAFASVRPTAAGRPGAAGGFDITLVPRAERSR